VTLGFQGPVVLSMSARQSLLNELQTAIEAGPKEKRGKTLRALTEVFVDVADRLPDELVEVFGDIISYLIETIEPEALVALAEKLAPVAKAPADVVQRLANDPNIAVAGTVLTHSERLTSPELAAFAASKDEKHLLAIAARKRLEAVVTDALLKRRSTEVTRALAGNAGAAFSDAGFGLLVEAGVNDSPTAEKLVQRADITPAQVSALVAGANDGVRKTLLAAAPAQRRATVEAAVDKNSKAAARTESAAQAYAHMTAVLKEKHEGRPMEADVFAYASAKKPVEVICSLAMICKVPPELVESLMDEQRREPFMMVCRAANFKWPTVRALVEMRERPGAALQDALTQACEDFNRISPVVAQHALKMWQKKAAGG
jgi:uncharacterized protein (DUF2336 family)